VSESYDVPLESPHQEQRWETSYIGLLRIYM
jgi:hypothetical protein